MLAKTACAIAASAAGLRLAPSSESTSTPQSSLIRAGHAAVAKGATVAHNTCLASGKSQAYIAAALTARGGALWSSEGHQWRDPSQGRLDQEPQRQRDDHAERDFGNP